MGRAVAAESANGKEMKMSQKITIKVCRRTDDDHEGHAEIEVHKGAVKVADGHIGGEPEDNRITRDYSWIVPMLEATAKACGADVEIETTEGGE